MELRQIALEVARILQDAGKHALNDQMNPHDMRKLEVSEDCFHFTSHTSIAGRDSTVQGEAARSRRTR